MKRFEPAMRRNTQWALCALAVAVLSACGGGGGGGNVREPPPSTPTTPPPTTPPSTPPPPIGAHLDLTNARSAQALGLTGQGVRIGVVDSGVRRDHPALNGRVGPMLIYTDPRSNNHRVDDVLGHGTYVSQIVAGTAVGAWPGGIAPGANIVSARILADTRPSDDGSGQGNEARDNGGLDIVSRDLMNAGVRIMNNSWGGLYWTGDNVTRSFIAAYQPFIDNGGLVVFATGNESKPQPSDNASLPSQGAGASVLERGWIAAAALDTLNPTRLASYSNACGIAMNYCLVAPGDVQATGVNDAVGNPSYWVVRGTSFAAPQVSGAAALVWQAFPYFNNDLVRQALLGNARDLGAPGVDPVFGQGLLDVGAAVRGLHRLDFGDVRVAFDGTSTWSNPLTGAGGLSKDGSGTLRLDSSAAHTYTGATEVAGGTLRLNDGGSLASPVTVRAGATFAGGNGAKIANRVDNQGALRVEGAGLRIDGDYAQSAAGQLQFFVGSKLDVGGAATLGGDARVLGQLPGYVRSSREVFLNAGSVSGQFASLSTAPGVFLTATLGYSGTQAWLDISALNIAATAQSLGMGAADVATATRVDGALGGLGGGATVTAPGGPQAFSAAAGALQRAATAQAAQRSLASLSGELHGADAAFALMAMEANRRALESRLDAQFLDPARSGAWSDRLDAQRAMAGRLDLDARGWIVGHDQRVGAWNLGAALSQTDGVAYSGERRDRERNRQTEGQLYAAWSRGDAYVLGRAAFGRMSRDLQREVQLGEMRFGTGADYADRYLTLGVQAGQRLRVGGGVLTPYVGAQALRLDRSGFEEAGAAGFGLSAGDSRLGATQLLAGARLERQWRLGSAQLGLSGRAEWQRTLAQSGRYIDARFTGIEAWSPILADPFAREAGVLGLSFSARLARGGAFALDVDNRYEFGRQYPRAFASWSLPF
ncbi:autotransporter serine protease [Lysobacter enzymogenes]|uniref:Autotransporter domain-containing protein n=1 Tax=Lysobacter enzymogenes TaxID=69 RepID=A0A3N2RGT9_LYSEN|nr:autotransporter serine protease [Lysobacter enzymogenes]ROU06655.1 autotransporter domain-containing protein [Lysobacter enzymogenes]